MRRHAIRKNAKSHFFLMSILFAALSLPSASSSKSGAPLDLLLLSLDGKKLHLADISARKPTLLYLWATWCKPCRKTTPKVSVLFTKHKDRLQVLGINVGGLDSMEEIKKYRKKYGIEYPLFLDCEEQTLKTFGVFAIPAFILLDRSGQVRFRSNMPPKDLEGFYQVCEP